MYRTCIAGLFAAALACVFAPGTAEAREQTPACGGPGQRACCILERATACDAGFRPVDLGDFPGACGPFAAGTCMPVSQPTACGGEGQRACCVFLLERLTACDFGLDVRGDDLAADLFVPVSGDATCPNESIIGGSTHRSTATCVRTNPAPIAEPVSGWTPTPEPRGIMRGYHDMHLHLLGHMAHGGKNVVGEPAPQSGTLFLLDANNTINEALSPATDRIVHKDPYHGLLNDTSGEGTGDGARSEFGAPYFSGWPKWHSTTHQQTYHVWLERAWRGGLRVATLFASHVESLCKTSLKATRPVSWPICEDSMRHVVDQLVMAREFERFIDWQNGGPGQGWFRIVTTPQQAREAVRAGKLAVVLGIEVDNLFNCKEAGCPADFGLPEARIRPLTTRAQPTTLEEAVDVIYDMGVRHVFPIHNFDNAFGGAATWMDPIGVGQAVAEQRWWITRDCGAGDDGYGFWIDNRIQSLMLFLGFGLFEVPPIPVYESGAFSDFASCNIFGLRPMGAQLIQALMNKGIMIDVDHMSSASVDHTVALTSSGPDGNGPAYPLVASHVQAFDLHQKEFTGNKGRHERMRTAAQLAAIRSSGGMVAAMLKDDVQDTDLKGGKYTLPYTTPIVGPAIADNCRHSSKTWAQLLQYTVDAMGAPVAMGSDWNGAAGHLGPRFGSDACGGWGAPNGRERPAQIIENSQLQYPFTLEGFGAFDPQVTGFKTFDYNVDGLAHIGLVPDMIADLKAIGLNDYYIDKLMCSGEAYVRVWERADALGARRPMPDPNRPWLCDVTDNAAPESTLALAPPLPAGGWYNTDVVATITATDADSGVEKIDYSVTAAPLANGPVAGSLATVTITGEGDRLLEYFATDLAGNVEANHNATVRIDRTVPTIFALRTPAGNADGWNNTAVSVSFTCADGLSGIDSCAAPVVLGSEGPNQSAAGDAVDVAGNVASASIDSVHIDLTPPVVMVTGVTDGATYDLNAVPQAECSSSDALSGLVASAVVGITGGTSNGVGTFVVSCTGARDRAGNIAAATATYSVRYVFGGFDARIATPPMLNTIKAGQTVPVKFSLGGDHGLDVLLGGAATSGAIGCGTGVAVDNTELTVNNPGGSQFTYDPVTATYQFNWKTEKSWSGSCRRLYVRLDDGTVQTADFRLQ